jgi:RNA recognition motif-containing protein
MADQRLNSAPPPAPYTGHPPDEVSVELYVGNLPWSMTDEELSSLFSAHGAVERAKVVMDRESGRSRGFGFVTMPNDAEGQAAIKAVNGSQQGGRAINVRAAEPRQSNGPRRGPGGGGGMGGGGGGGRDRY